MDRFEHASPDQPKIAIDVANLDWKERPRKGVVDVPDPDAMPGIVALKLIPIDETDLGPHLRDQFRQLADVVLSVAVGVEDEFLARRRESRSKSAAVAAIPFVS